jgi:hypothetical protein
VHLFGQQQRISPRVLEMTSFAPRLPRALSFLVSDAEASVVSFVLPLVFNVHFNTSSRQRSTDAENNILDAHVRARLFVI